MAATAATVVAGTAAVAAYLDAKYHIRHDIEKGNMDIAATQAEAMAVLTERAQQNRLLTYHNIEHWAKLNRPNHSFLDFEGRSWTYNHFYQDVQRVGNWLMQDLGIQPCEMVALSAPNSAEFLLLWFALEAIGASISFINHNLTGDALAHCVKLGKPRILLADTLTGPRTETIRTTLTTTSIQIIYFSDQLLFTCTDPTPIPSTRTLSLLPTDTRSLIFTSGTTGLPKGTIESNGRTLLVGRTMSRSLKLTTSSKFYTCLPLYHAAAQGLCFRPAIWAGASVCLGRKFSHATFWPEVAGSRATILQYVGELCRYLVNGPVHELERRHCVGMAWGNGMRGDVWERFRTRFGIKIVNEFYGASDGLGATSNWNCGEFGRGAIAVRGKLWEWRRGPSEARVRIDPDTEEIVRDGNGWCERVGVNEPGETIHKVDPALAMQAFRGYFGDEKASEKRWLKGVFGKGDLWFRSGDVMRQDADGRLYFVDRLGDTFRWKSENVSTNEVADVLGAYDQIAEANVYGVALPHADGRCGCATVVLQDGINLDALDLKRLARHVQARLPRYALPFFLRVAPQLSYTGTFKIQKGVAKREGVDIDLIEQSGSKDQLYWLPPDASAYEPYSRDAWASLKSGKVKL